MEGTTKPPCREMTRVREPNRVRHLEKIWCPSRKFSQAHEKKYCYYENEVDILSALDLNWKWSDCVCFDKSRK